MDKFMELLKKVKNPIFRIILVICFLVIIGIGILTGCATSTKFDNLNIDNFSHYTSFPSEKK